MKYQITSAQGPTECEIAAAKLLQSLQKEFPELHIIRKEPADTDLLCRTAVIEYNGSGELPRGTIQWICQSPCRPTHKRKNWFIGIFALQEVYENLPRLEDIYFETFRSAGKGGQHVNKTETGVRAIHPPTGQSAVCTQERSQHRNKQIAAERLMEKIKKSNSEKESSEKIHRRNERLRLERGQPVRIYKGKDFQRMR